MFACLDSLLRRPSGDSDAHSDFGMKMTMGTLVVEEVVLLDVVVDVVVLLDVDCRVCRKKYGRTQKTAVACST